MNLLDVNRFVALTRSKQAAGDAGPLRRAELKRSQDEPCSPADVFAYKCGTSARAIVTHLMDHPCHVTPYNKTGHMDESAESWAEQVTILVFKSNNAALCRTFSTIFPVFLA